MKHLEKLQTLLPLGYLYLILLGLLNESLTYYPLGINILNYSSISDILIRPISEMFDYPILIIIICSVFLLLFIIQNILVNYKHKSWVQKILGRERFDYNVDKKEIQKIILPFFLTMLGIMLLSFFVGLGLGGGLKISKRIKNNTFTCNYKITFTDGKAEEVFMFDNNSSYYFYVTKQNTNIRIAPVGTIFTLEKIKK